MAFRHRKLNFVTPNETLSNNCLGFCNPLINKDGSCPISCMSRCYLICTSPISSESPPSPPPLSSSYLPPPPSIDLHHKSQKLAFSISIVVLAITFLLVASYSIYKGYIRWTNSRRRLESQREEFRGEFLDGDDEPDEAAADHPIWYIRTVGLQSSVIRAITVCKYKRGDGLVEGTECSVCLNEFQEDETLRLLPKCNHAFHIPCIDTWLSSHTNCPMCRAGIVLNAAGLPTPEPSTGENLGPVQETHLRNAENNVESGRYSEDEASEVRIRVEEEVELPIANGTRLDENLREEEGNSDRLAPNVVQAIRRSVSVDCLSDSVISLSVTDDQSDKNPTFQVVKLNEPSMTTVSAKRGDGNQSPEKSVAGSSNECSEQKTSISMDRSFSWGGKVLLSRYSRSRNSVL